MKKIANNGFFGKLAMITNVLILCMFVVSMICLLSFDKINIKLVSNTADYTNADAELREVEKPRRKAQSEVDYYAFKLDTLKKQTLPADKKKVKEQQEDIEKTEHTLEAKEAELARVDSTIHAQTLLCEAIQAPYKDLKKQAESAKFIFTITLYITILLFIIKILFFAAWNHKGLRNLRITSIWMKKSTSPYWAYLGWIIPIYNFVKPFSVFSEVYNETNYILLDKNIIQKGKDTNSDFNLGLWWGLLLISTVLMSFVLNATFFNEGPMYFKLSHIGVAITAIIMWALYLLQESVLIYRGIKMNQILIENHSKFDLQ
ncbi:MAG: DUF4328 domain-containing protein [Bacteroidales bacterium]|jgi:hypothetical protein|nr:DUF4328 domain-containing protein [Bacteroidales bacterium]